jgi:hypothetical protein
LTVKLPKRVLERWRELSADSSKVRIELLLTSELDPVAATQLLSRTVTRVVHAFDARHAAVPPGVDEPFAGEWDVARVPEGAMLIGGYKSDAFEELLQAIVEDLGREGVRRGTLDLYALPEVPSPPAGIGVIEARVRVLGRRVVNGRDRWAANRAALDRVLKTATRWCWRPGRIAGSRCNGGRCRRCWSAAATPPTGGCATSWAMRGGRHFAASGMSAFAAPPSRPTRDASRSSKAAR